MEFKVTWEVRYSGYEPEKVYFTEEYIDHDDLDSLIEGGSVLNNLLIVECTSED